MDLAVTQPNKDIDIKLEEILPKLGRQLQDKLMYSINLLRKAEKLAMHYDPRKRLLQHVFGREGQPSDVPRDEACRGQVPDAHEPHVHRPARGNPFR